jgi:beta-lactamase regulating signal transducer with metallopeptidase domain
MNELSFLVDLALRSSMVLGAAFLILALMRRASAAERHLLLLLGVVIVLLLPVGLIAGPRIFWNISLPVVEKPREVMEATSASPESPLSGPPVIVSEIPAPTPSIYTVSNVVVVILGAGAIAQGMILVQAAFFWRRVRREAKPANLHSSALEEAQSFAGTRSLPPILVSDEISVPVLVGWLRPVIILPRTALEKAVRSLTMMLCHELAHFRRGDLRLLPLLALLRIVYWWHPLVWLALARLRRERECACDDLMLAQKYRASDYADLIVAAARSLKATSSIPMGALAMATSSSVSQRIIAVLDPALRRRPTSLYGSVVGSIIALGVGWVIAASQIRAADSTTSSATNDGTKRQVLLEFKFASFSDAAYAGHQAEIDAAIAKNDELALVTFLNNAPGCDLISAPSVTTLEGLRAQVDILHEFPIPQQTAKGKDGKMVALIHQNVGVSASAFPTISKDNTSMNLDLKGEVIDFAGWKETAPGVKEPIFVTRSVSRTHVAVAKNLILWLSSTPVYSDPFHPSAPSDHWLVPNDQNPRRMLLILSTRVVPTEPKPVMRPVDNRGLMVRTALKFFQINEKTYSQQPAAIDAALRAETWRFSPASDFDLLSEPTVLSKLGEQAVLEDIHHIPYPEGPVPSDQNPRKCGIRVVLKTALPKTGGISLAVFPELTRYAGQVVSASGDTTPTPIFSTTRLNLALTVNDGASQGFWMGLGNRDMRKIMNWKDGTPAPFVPDNTPVRIGMIVTTDLYTQDGQLLRDPQPKRVQLIDKFNTLVFHNIDLHQATLSEVVQALTVESVKVDPNHLGINFVLNLTTTTAAPKVDLKFENASPKEIVDAIAKQTGFTYAIDDYAIYLRPPLRDEQSLTVRTYLAPASLLAQIRGGTEGQAQDAHPQTNGIIDVKTDLSALGFKFPTGASAVLISESDKMVVRDTPDQLDAIATYIEKASEHQ